MKETAAHKNWKTLFLDSSFMIAVFLGLQSFSFNMDKDSNPSAHPQHAENETEYANVMKKFETMRRVMERNAFKEIRKVCRE